MRVALTGGIASGKSTAAAIFAELGATVIDSDQIAREVVARGTRGLAQVVAAFGPRILTAEGDLDRPALGSIVFADPQARLRLEAILHPLIAQRSAELQAAAGPGALVIQDIPLLVETGQQSQFDEVVVIDVPVEVQVQRMMHERGMSAEEAQARLAAQADRELRLAAATRVIDNSASFADLRSRVIAVYEALVAAQATSGEAS